MENGPFEDVFPIKNGGFSIAMLVYQRVTLAVYARSSLRKENVTG